MNIMNFKRFSFYPNLVKHKFNISRLSIKSKNEVYNMITNFLTKNSFIKGEININYLQSIVFNKKIY